MTQAVSTSLTRRIVVMGLTLAAASLGVMAETDKAKANQTTPEKSLHERWAASSPSRRWWITSVTPS
ncbi:hypothetical protein [Rhizobium sp. ARZ01]|uniref:hypothetical protein n=1 Tax=Rhizobium sp. ARZ01 TaxID=2769313 RepID=UPI001FEECD9A|nr:hypothetical protein [Rhizobium sp. ARZ01]